MTLHPIAVTDGALKTTPPDPEKVRQTARGFEGLFLSQLIKIMKNSIPKDEKQGMLSSGTMTEFADMELGRVLAEKRGIGLADALVKKLTPTTTPRNVERTTAVHRAPLTKKPPSMFEPQIRKAAREHGLHPELLRAVMEVESAGKPQAESPRGAKGLMQLADSTAKMLGAQNVWDPEQNIQGSARYLRKLMDQFDQRLDHALAAYNAGPTAVTRHGGISPYAETQKYVKRVLNLFYGKPPAAIYGT